MKMCFWEDKAYVMIIQEQDPDGNIVCLGLGDTKDLRWPAREGAVQMIMEVRFYEELVMRYGLSERPN